MARPARFERATYALEGRDYEYFGNDFGNKGVVLPQTLVIPIDLAEEVSQKPPKVSYWPKAVAQNQSTPCLSAR